MSKPRTFKDSLAKGRLAESQIAGWLRRHGWTVIPVYEIEEGHGKGPQIYAPENEMIAPDLLAWKENRFRFIEAKNKSVFTRYRETHKWQTGIDLKHYEHYLSVGRHFGLDIWLMFLHESGQPSDEDLAYTECPRDCPTGLFGNPLQKLKDRVDHKSSRWGKTGMVYWDKESLQLICSISELTSTTVESFAFERAVISGQQGKLL